MRGPSAFPGNRPPVYPPQSAARGERGNVVLRLSIAVDGSVSDVVVEQSSGYPALDASALAAARTWHFQPASRDGRPIHASIRQTVRFS